MNEIIYYQPDALDLVLPENTVLEIVKEYVNDVNKVDFIDETGGEARVYSINDKIILKVQRPNRLRNKTSLKRETFFLNELEKHEEIKSPKEISRETGIRYHTLLNILSDLRKKGIVSRELGINYPLLKEWLLARELPPSGIKRVDLLRQSLGITIEYYVRELFRHINRKIVLEGEQFFIGTAKKISLGPIDNVSGGGEIDLIAHQTDCLTWVGEIKIGKVSKGDLMKFLERVRRIKERKVCIVIASDADPLALAEMVRNGVIFMQLKTLNEMAKKVGFPKINLPQ